MNVLHMRPKRATIEIVSSLYLIMKEWWLYLFLKRGEARPCRGWQSRPFNQGVSSIIGNDNHPNSHHHHYHHYHHHHRHRHHCHHDNDNKTMIIIVQGGREHNLPILVSRVTSNSPAARCRNVFICIHIYLRISNIFFNLYHPCIWNKFLYLSIYSIHVFTFEFPPRDLYIGDAIVKINSQVSFPLVLDLENNQ